MDVVSVNFSAMLYIDVHSCGFALLRKVAFILLELELNSFLFNCTVSQNSSN